MSFNYRKPEFIFCPFWFQYMMKSSENTVRNFWQRVHFLRYFKYYVLVPFEVGTENAKTFIKQKYTLNNCRHVFFQQLFFTMYTNFKGATRKIF